MPTATRIDLPRPAIIAAVGVLVLAVTFLVTKAGDSGNVSSTATTSPAAQTSTASTTTSTTATSTTPKPSKPQLPTIEAGPGMPAPVARALNQGKVVVLFFFEPAASDDQATHAALDAARAAAGAGSHAVAVFQDVVARISAYRRVTGSLGISQSPAMVVIDRSRHAELLQGYLDSGTIRQTVRDAL